jgi:uncharacterized protein (DUF983 family)
MPEPGGRTRRDVAMLTALALVVGLFTVVSAAVSAEPALAAPGDCPAWATDNVTECTVSSLVSPGPGPWVFKLPLHVTATGHIDGSASGITLNVDGAAGLDLVLDNGAVIEADDDNVATPNTGASPVTITVSGDLSMAAGARISADNDIQDGAGGNIDITVAGDMVMSGTTGVDQCRSFDIPGDGFEFYKYGPFLAPNVYQDPSLGARISAHRWGASASTPAGNITIVVGNYGVPPSGTMTMERCSLVDVSGRGSAGEIEITAGRVANLDGLVLSESGESGQSPNQPRGGGPITVRAGCQLTVSDTGMISSKGQDPGADLVHLKGCAVTIFGIVQSTTIAGHVLPNQPANRCNQDTTAHPPGAASGFSACVRILGQDVTIDATGTHNGNVNVDGVRGPARGWIDVFATKDVTIVGAPTPAPAAVSANACSSGPCSNSFGGVVTITAIGGKVDTSGQAVVQANATAIGSDGGVVTIQAGGPGIGTGDVALDASFIEASTALSSDNTVGGTIAIKSFNSAITSGGSAAGHIDASGGATAGAVTLTECALVDSYLGAVAPPPTENRGVCGGQPTVPADAQQLFDENAPIWEACNPFAPPTKSGTKFDDANNNGARDQGEAGLPGWTIDLLDTSNVVLKQTVTDKDGNYTFAIDAAGTYRVCEEAQTGWAQTFPHSGGVPPPNETIIDACPGTAAWGYEFTAASGQTFTGDDFGNFQSAPLALVTHVCAASGLDVTVKNTGNVSGTFSINGVSQVLAPGASFTQNVAVAENASVQVTVLLDNVDVPGSPFTFLRDCQQPGASVSHQCAASGLDVTVTNTGDEAGTFSINGTAQVVQPGQSFTQNVPVAGGASVQVTVLLDNVDVAGSPFTFLRDCQQPGASVSHQCAASGLDVTVTNTGDDTGLFSINGIEQSLAPGAHFTQNVAVAEGDSVQVTVLLDGSDVAGSPFTFLRDCEQPGAQAANNCTAGGIDLVLTNSGASPTTFEVTKNGVVIDHVVVGANSTVVVSYPLTEDEVAVFRVTGPGFDSGDLSVIHDCVQVSAPPIVTRALPPSPSPAPVPSQLAFTGGPFTVPLAITGGMFLGTGVLAVLASRRKKRLMRG